MIIERLLLTLETVPLAKIANFIQAELQRRAEYAARFGLAAPRLKKKINRGLRG